MRPSSKGCVPSYTGVSLGTSAECSDQDGEQRRIGKLNIADADNMRWEEVAPEVVWESPSYTTPCPMVFRRDWVEVAQGVADRDSLKH